MSAHKEENTVRTVVSYIYTDGTPGTFVANTDDIVKAVEQLKMELDYEYQGKVAYTVVKAEVIAEDQASVQEAIDFFDQMSNEFANFGAIDTEPRAEFTNLLEALVAYGDAKVPKGALRWGLFTTMEGAEAAAYAMSVAANKVVEAAKVDPSGLREAFKNRYGFLPY